MGRAGRHGAPRRQAGRRRLNRLARLVKRSFSLTGHRTSIALEAEFWQALADLAARRGQRLSALIADLDAARDPRRPLASALRVFTLQSFRPEI